MIAHDRLDSELAGDRAFDERELLRRVAPEPVHRDHDRHAELAQVGDMPGQIGEAGLQRRKVLRGERVFGDAAVHFERSHRGDQHRRRWLQSRLSALDVEEFLRAEIGAKARLGDDVVSQLERRSGRHHRVAAVSDVGERAAMHERGRPFEGLHEIGPERALEQRRHRACRVEVSRGDRAPVPARGRPPSGRVAPRDPRGRTQGRKPPSPPRRP